MLTFDHLDDRWSRERRRQAVLRDMLDVLVSEHVTGSDGERVDYVVTLGDETRLVLHLMAHQGAWGQA